MGEPTPNPGGSEGATNKRAPMELGHKTALASVGIGVAAGFVGVAMPLGFDVTPVVWRTVLCLGMASAALGIAYLLYEHFARSHPDPRVRSIRSAIFSLGAFTTIVVTILISIMAPTPHNYLSDILAQQKAQSVNIDKLLKTAPQEDTGRADVQVSDMVVIPPELSPNPSKYEVEFVNAGSHSAFVQLHSVGYLANANFFGFMVNEKEVAGYPGRIVLPGYPTFDLFIYKPVANVYTDAMSGKAVIRVDTLVRYKDTKTGKIYFTPSCHYYDVKDKHWMIFLRCPPPT